MPENMSEAFEAVEHIENPFAENKAALVGEVIEDLTPKRPEMEEVWKEFTKDTNPNENKQLFEFTTEYLLDPELIKKLGTDTTEALEQIVAGSPNYNRYRNAAAETYDFIGDLFDQGLAETEKIQGLVASFGSESFPRDQEQLAAMLGVSLQELPNFSQEMFLNMENVDKTLKMSASLGKDTTRGAQPQTEGTTEEQQTSGEESKIFRAEVVFDNNEWLADDIDGETKDWLNNNGHENIAGEYSETERDQAETYSELIYEQATIEANENPGVDEILQEVFDGEGDSAQEAQEAFKLLLRTAVKAGVSLAVIIAKNIAKDKDIPKELRIMMGIFADGLTKAGDFTDKAIAGDVNADLQRDIIAFITDKYN